MWFALVLVILIPSCFFSSSCLTFLHHLKYVSSVVLWSLVWCAVFYIGVSLFKTLMYLLLWMMLLAVSADCFKYSTTGGCIRTFRSNHQFGWWANKHWEFSHCSKILFVSSQWHCECKLISSRTRFSYNFRFVPGLTSSVVFLVGWWFVCESCSLLYVVGKTRSGHHFLLQRYFLIYLIRG